MDKMRRSFLLLTIAFIAGVIVYQVAPGEVQPGTYAATLTIDSSGIQVSYPFELDFVASGGGEETVLSFTGTATNVTVYYNDAVLIATGSDLTVVVNAVGAPIAAAEITILLEGSNDFRTLLRPTHQSGQTFRIEYQPLVRSQAASMILVTVAILWFTEGVSLVATSILIPVLIVVLNVQNPTVTLSSFFDPAVALILGGFMIARAIDKYELDSRLALLILSKSAGSGSRLVLAVMAATAFLSLWISNTAAAAIMIPIALAVIGRIQSDDVRGRYGKAIILGVAYSATLGGIGTLVGSPPNPLAAAYLKSFLGVEVSFVTWLPFGLPIVLVMIPLVWQWLMFRFKLPRNIEELGDLKEASRTDYNKLGPMSSQEKIVMLVFVAVIALWLTETIHGISSPIVALMGGFALFAVRLLDEKDVSSGISWSSLLILGSGIALGEAMIVTGISTFIAEQMQGLGMLPSFLVIIIMGLLAVLLTMFASNTGAAVILIPIAVPLATGLGLNPMLVVMVIAICVSMDFALPTGTPPSTIAYSTGKLQLREMISTGIVVDLTAILVVTIVAANLWIALGMLVF